jgi:RimJ/RimL family protein N-acetyltransferase
MPDRSSLPAGDPCRRSDRRRPLWPGTDEDTLEFLARKLAHWHEHGFGIWMLRDPATTFIGRCGIHRWRDEAELGYIVKPSFWGQGYGTEMATAVAHAFTALNLSNLVAFTKHDNIASRRVMEKVGFLYERDFIDDGVQSSLPPPRGFLLVRRLPQAPAGVGHPRRTAASHDNSRLQARVITTAAHANRRSRTSRTSLSEGRAVHRDQ